MAHPGGYEKPPPYFEEQRQQQQPPPMGFMETTSTTIITGQPRATHVIISTPVALGHCSQLISCPHCQAQVSTAVQPETGALTHIIALVLCLVGCWPCCLIPYCADGCKDTIHSCPNCGKQVAYAKRM